MLLVEVDFMRNIYGLTIEDLEEYFLYTWVWQGGSLPAGTMMEEITPKTELSLKDFCSYIDRGGVKAI